MTRMLLQRMLRREDGWATVLPFCPADATRVQAFADQMTQCAPVWWHVVRDDVPTEVLAVHDGRSWKTVGEAMPAPTDMPWWETGLATAYRMLRARRADPGDDFPATQPMEPRS